MSDTTTTKTLVPTAKVAAGAGAGAATILLVWVANLCGLDVPAEVASAVTVLLSTAAAWLKKETSAQ